MGPWAAGSESATEGKAPIQRILCQMWGSRWRAFCDWLPPTPTPSLGNRAWPRVRVHLGLSQPGVGAHLEAGSPGVEAQPSRGRGGTLRSRFHSRSEWILGQRSAWGWSWKAAILTTVSPLLGLELGSGTLPPP